MSQKIEHPSHYNWIPGVECLDVAEHFNFNLGNALKYIWRAGRKDGESALDDLQKARFYLDREIERLTPPQPVSAEEAARLLTDAFGRGRA